MSIVVPRGSLARSLRNGSPCPNCETRELMSVARASRRRHALAFAFSTSIRHGVHQWRQQVVSDLNEKDSDIKRPQNSRPGLKDGILQLKHYADKPTFMPISLEPLPKPDVDIPEENSTLASTRPPPFIPAKREPSESQFSYLLRIGRTYWTFYKTGLKNLLANRREVSELKGWIHPFSIGGVARFGGNPYQTKQGTEVPIPHIFRREFQLFHRTRADLKKLIPFSLLLLICGEFTPIALLVLGRRAVPKVCYLPNQQREEMDDIVSRFKTWRREMNKLTKASRVEKPSHAFDFTPRGGRLEHPWRRDLLFGHMVGLTGFYRLPFPVTRGIYWHFIMLHRLRDYWDTIFCDTILIKREGGFAAMSPIDVYEYARHYGSLSLFVIMEREIGKKNYDFIDETLKQRLVPVLEQEADIMLNEDFTRLTPNLHWARAYRDSACWASSPDVVKAAKLLEKYEAEDKAQEALASKNTTPTKLKL